MSFRNSIADQLKHNRPKLADSSIKTYVSILYNLHKLLKKEEERIQDFDDSKDVLDILKDKPSKVRKTVLSALYILTNNEEYRKMMISDCGIVNNEYKAQKMDEKQKDNWISTAEIQAKYNNLMESVKEMFAKQKLASYSDIMNFLLLAVLGGVSGMPPRRSLDYSLMKIREYDIKKDNYYKSGKFYFNKFKTSERYGLQILDVPKELDSLIKKWVKLNPTDFFLFSSNKQPVSSSQINRMLNTIFDGKQISCDMLRHIYLTNLYKDVPALTQMEKTAEDMGHSVGQAMLYIKRDAQ